MDKQELDTLKKECAELTAKLKELSEEELKEVMGGSHCGIYVGQELMVHAPTYDDLISEGEIKPTSTEGWFGTKDN